MILAAGLGLRMRPLTDHTPKVLLEVNGKALIDYHLEALAQAGVDDVVINLHHLGRLVEAHVGDGEQWGLSVAYSREAELLETAGGIHRALPLLGHDPFMVVSGDIYTDYDFAQLPGTLTDRMAHLVMVDNPPHHPEGDFAIDDHGRLTATGDEKLTYAGIGVFSPALFEDLAPGAVKLRAVFEAGIAGRQLTGEYFKGAWSDVGTPERLAGLNR